jgi:hypothetical protein
MIHDDNLSDDEWLKRGSEAFRTSTTYIDANFRKEWEDGIAMFGNKHPASSQFNSPAKAKMSKLFRPKTRALVRKNEAAAALAFFSNTDVTSISALDPTNPQSVVGAELMKEVLNYRLGVSINWFRILIGAFQDAQTVGVVISEQTWAYEKRDGKVIKDHPEVILVPVEQFRIDPSARWDSPIESSPYLIHLKPMYVGEVREMIKAGNWFDVSDEELLGATKSTPDTTAQVRDYRTQPVRAITDYETVWVQRHIHRLNGVDYEFYTLGTSAMLTSPKLLTESVFHGKRPYVMGVSVIESHKTIPTSLVNLGKDIQEEANIVVNQRLDNVKLVMNKRWIAKRGANVDYQSLLRNVPGAITEVDDLNDVRSEGFQDITGSSYMEQDRINVDYDDLMGNFSAGSVQTNRQLNETVGGMEMLKSPAMLQTEYLLRTFVETWVEPVLRQLILLEQAYETDERILNIAGQKAQLFQRFGVDNATDELLQQELQLKVNVGMGATDPVQKVNKLVSGIDTMIRINQANVPNLNVNEVSKELFASMGYGDASRFFNVEQDPRMVQMEQMIQKLTEQLNSKNQELDLKAKLNQQDNATRYAVAAMQEDARSDRAILEHARAALENPVAQMAAAQIVRDDDQDDAAIEQAKQAAGIATNQNPQPQATPESIPGEAMPHNPQQPNP